LQQSDLHKVLAPGKLALSLNLSDGSSLVCDEVVRVIPNKRLVCKGIWQQKAAYAKLFIDTRAAQYFARDLSGVTDLLQKLRRRLYCFKAKRKKALTCWCLRRLPTA
jgi:hypothetical protein